MPTHRHPRAWTWITLAILAGATGAAACGKSDKRPPAAAKDASTKPGKTPLQREIEKALILESALDKAKAELTAAEQATPRDEVLVAERASAIKAIEDSIKRSRQMIEVLRTRER